MGHSPESMHRGSKQATTIVQRRSEKSLGFGHDNGAGISGWAGDMFCR